MNRSAAVAMLVWSLWAIPCRAADSPEGVWKTIDDRRGTERSLVRIWREGDELRGKVEHVFPRVGQPAHPLCELCPGEKKNKPVEGLEILWGFRQRDGEWTGGRVLDPEEGKIYKGTIRLIEGGRKLVVRGYVGISMFGRSQTWVRME